MPPDPAEPEGKCRPTRVVNGRHEPVPDEAIEAQREREIARLRARFAAKQASREAPVPQPQPQPQLQSQPRLPPVAARPTMLPVWPSEAELAELAATACDHDSEDSDMW